MTANGAFFQTGWQLSIAFWTVFDHGLIQQYNPDCHHYYCTTDIFIN